MKNSRAPRICVSACGLLLATLTVASTAAPPPETVTIAQVLEILQEKSPRYAALKYQIETARAEIVGAGVLPNPKVAYGRYDLTSRNNTMYDGNSQENYTVDVPIQIAGQRGARVETAERNVARSEAEVQAQFADLVHETWLQYVRLQALQAREEVLEDATSDVDRLHRIVQGREQGGSASAYDVMRMSLESLGLESRLASVRSDIAAASGSLGAMVGIKDWHPKAALKLAPLNIDAIPPEYRDTAVLQNPEVEAALRGEATAEAGLEQARRERWPTPSLQFGTAFTGKPYGNTTYAGIEVELPIFDRGQGGMARAAAAKQSAILEREAITARTQAEIKTALEVLNLRRENLETFNRDVLQPLPRLKEMAENAYRLGKGSLLELLDATRSRTEIRLNQTELVQTEIEAELDVLKATGALLNTFKVDKK